jgi:hypothetical protein
MVTTPTHEPDPMSDPDWMPDGGFRRIPSAHDPDVYMDAVADDAAWAGIEARIHEAAGQVPDMTPEWQREPVVPAVAELPPSDDPYGAKAARERAEKDARNARDRERRLRVWNDRVAAGDKPRGGFKPKP